MGFDFQEPAWIGSDGLEYRSEECETCEFQHEDEDGCCGEWRDDDGESEFDVSS